MRWIRTRPRLGAPSPSGSIRLISSAQVAARARVAAHRAGRAVPPDARARRGLRAGPGLLRRAPRRDAELKDERIAERSNHSNLCRSELCSNSVRIQEILSELIIHQKCRKLEEFCIFSRMLGEIPNNHHLNLGKIR